MRPGGGARLAASGLRARQRKQSGIRVSDFRSELDTALGKYNRWPRLYNGLPWLEFHCAKGWLPRLSLC